MPIHHTIHTIRLGIASVLLLAILAPLRAQQHEAPQPQPGKTVETLPGHSPHGRVFDAGPRQQPWLMDGIGQSHFPITVANAEAQKWFDQGNTLLHSYWAYEAERSFRWALKLDPECAMCYWAMARVSGGNRRATFIREAVKRKSKVTPRERLYIEAWEERWVQEDPLPEEAKQARFEHALQEICMKYPDDIEAKLLYANERLASKDPYGIDAILQNVLAVAPRHPGALHYRIHLWDRKEPQYILSNSALYGSIATGVGHGQHMVGHIYSSLGMWHEAAISMDISDRVELRYMKEHMTFPFHDWSYAHNRDYLSYVQEQLGMYKAAVAGARELLAVPLDPKYNPAGDPEKAHEQGVESLMRALIKFEKWNAILQPENIPWTTTLRDEMSKSYCQALAWIGLGDLDKAGKSVSAHASLKEQFDKPENKDLVGRYEMQSAELQARLELAKGNTQNGLSILADAAKRDLDFRRSAEALNRGAVLYNVLGEAYLSQHTPDSAVTAFAKTLESVPNDGFALAGLAEAYAAMGKTAEAENALARLLFVWSDADRDLPWLDRLRHWKLKAQPLDASSAEQRRYSTVNLQQFGPDAWEPYRSPLLDAVDAKGEKITVDNFRGQNVLLVFYPTGDCPSCTAHLIELGKRRNDFLGLGTEIVVVGGHTTQDLAALARVNQAHIPLLWDPNFEDARRFHAYDDFEEIPLNGIVMINKNRRVYWSREGGDPFNDFDFLLKEVQHMNEGAGNATKIQ